MCCRGATAQHLYKLQSTSRRNSIVSPSLNPPPSSIYDSYTSSQPSNYHHHHPRSRRVTVTTSEFETKQTSNMDDNNGEGHEEREEREKQEEQGNHMENEDHGSNENREGLEDWEIPSINVAEWTVGQVSRWIAEHSINGECLLRMTHHLLRELNVESVGHRLSILHAIKHAKHSYSSPQPETYIVSSTGVAYVPMAEYHVLETIVQKRDSQIEDMGRELKKCKEEVAVAWDLLADEIEKRAAVKAELLRLRRLHQLTKDEGAQTEGTFLDFLEWRDQMEEQVEEEDNGGDMLARGQTQEPDTAVQLRIQDTDQRALRRICRGHEISEDFDEYTGARFKKASALLRSALRVLKVEEDHEDWQIWVRFGKRQIKLGPNDFPVKVCREFRKDHNPDEVMILVRHRLSCMGSGYILDAGQ
ncbi:hypothetical protein TWF718_002813 [Orbilia javanica]|uniref:SAM domain-containing protein n=1 Tax=Orbilia javanica TaxID=47235 RepID=A0AAN8RAC0_9PEZI